MQGKIVVFVSLAVLMGLSCLGCDYYPFKPDPPDFQIFQLHIDSLTVTSPLAASDTMRVGYYTSIDLCSGLVYVDTTRIDLVGYKLGV